MIKRLQNLEYLVYLNMMAIFSFGVFGESWNCVNCLGKSSVTMLKKKSKCLGGSRKNCKLLWVLVQMLAN